MKRFLIAAGAAGALMICGGAAIAQDAATQQDGTAATSAATPDPNAGQPTGAVPADVDMVPAPADAPHDPAAPVGSAENPVTVGGNMTPPPTEAKVYPLCSRTVQDSCINPGEAHKTHAKS